MTCNSPRAACVPSRRRASSPYTNTLGPGHIQWNGVRHRTQPPRAIAHVSTVKRVTLIGQQRILGHFAVHDRLLESAPAVRQLSVAGS
mmetsp:Transcript_16786/g.45453  ORF Transcript_16786/g.45453 Transcript_16786/m.45453 type:complete len:88 (+) Transcript_16786:277-540(+)